MKKLSILLVNAMFLVVMAVGPVHATIINFGVWYEFGFGQAGTFAFDGSGCIPSSGNNSQPAPIPPWTYYTAAPTASLVTIVDAFNEGDVFKLYDSGSFVGSTTFVGNTGSDSGTSDPDVALGIDALSRGFFSLLPGDHSLAIQISRNALGFSGGCAYFRVDAVPIPLPPSVYLLGTSLLGLIGLRRKRKTS
jgi:hypothetical protein